MGQYYTTVHPLQQRKTPTWLADPWLQAFFTQRDTLACLVGDCSLQRALPTGRRATKGMEEVADPLPPPPSRRFVYLTLIRGPVGWTLFRPSHRSTKL